MTDGSAIFFGGGGGEDSPDEEEPPEVPGLWSIMVVIIYTDAVVSIAHGRPEAYRYIRRMA